MTTVHAMTGEFIFAYFTFSIYLGKLYELESNLWACVIQQHKRLLMVHQ